MVNWTQNLVGPLAPYIKENPAVFYAGLEQTIHSAERAPGAVFSPALDDRIRVVFYQKPPLVLMYFPIGDLLGRGANKDVYPGVWVTIGPPPTHNTHVEEVALSIINGKLLSEETRQPGRGPYLSPDQIIKPVLEGEETIQRCFRRDGCQVGLMPPPHLIVRRDNCVVELIHRLYYVSFDHIYKGEVEIEPPDILKRMDQVFQGLLYLYREGVIHRDVKPANILISHDGKKAVLMDWDRVVESTQVYAPDEASAYKVWDQCGMEGSFTKMTDVYGWGVTLGLVVFKALFKPFFQNRSKILIPEEYNRMLEIYLMKPVEASPREKEVTLEQNIHALILRIATLDDKLFALWKKMKPTSDETLRQMYQRFVRVNGDPCEMIQAELRRIFEVFDRASSVAGGVDPDFTAEYAVDVAHIEEGEWQGGEGDGDEDRESKLGDGAVHEGEGVAARGQDYTRKSADDEEEHQKTDGEGGEDESPARPPSAQSEGHTPYTHETHNGKGKKHGVHKKGHRHVGV
jgi:serine/threonine protein kinase